MPVIHFHVEPENLLAAVAAEIGSEHPLITAMRDVFDRFEETEGRARDLERRLDDIESRLDRSHVRR